MLTGWKAREGPTGVTTCKVSRSKDDMLLPWGKKEQLVSQVSMDEIPAAGLPDSQLLQ